MNKLIAIISLLITLTSSIMGSAQELKKENMDYQDSPKWVAQLGKEKEATQLFVVAAVGQTTAYVSMHEKDARGQWKEIIDEKTPQGTYHFNAAFGIAADPGCAMPYHQVTKDDYWSGDPREGYAYNQLVSIKEYPGLDVKNVNTEHLIQCDPEYTYCLNISYNEDCVPGVGGAIFLHCTGKIKPFTGGCVAIPEEYMLQVMQNVKPECVVVIDELKTLSPETWKRLRLD